MVQGSRTIRMDLASFADFWAPAEGGEGPIAEFVASLEETTKITLRDAVRSAYLDGEGDGARSYAATAWWRRARCLEVPICSVQRPSRFSTRLRELPTFLTAFFTAEADRPVFFASYRTS